MPEAHEPVWTGDPEDDCVLWWRGYIAHAEAVSDHAWYVGVWKTRFREPEGFLGMFGDGKYRPHDEQVFHSSDDDTLPLSGPAARRLAETVIVADAARRRAGF